MDIAYLNGQQLPLAQASVPVLDRGLLFADAVYEVIPVYAGKAFLLDEHLQRLANSLAGIRLANPHTDDQWQGLLNALIDANGGGDLSLYLQVTRGAAPRRDHRLPENPTPNVIAFCQSRKPPDAAVFDQGVATISMQDTRWTHCQFKSTSLLANILASDDAARAGATEAIMLRDGQVMEGASSNIFAVIDGVVQTPRLRPEILPGITRGLLLKLAKANAVECLETDVSLAQLKSAEEIWLTSSIREIFPVTRLDEQPVGTGKPSPIWAQMRRLIHASTA